MNETLHFPTPSTITQLVQLNINGEHCSFQRNFSLETGILNSCESMCGCFYRSLVRHEVQTQLIERYSIMNPCTILDGFITILKHGSLPSLTVHIGLSFYSSHYTRNISSLSIRYPPLP